VTNCLASLEGRRLCRVTFHLTGSCYLLHIIFGDNGNVVVNGIEFETRRRVQNVIETIATRLALVLRVSLWAL